MVADRSLQISFHALPLDANLGKGQYGPTGGMGLYDLQSDPHEVNKSMGNLNTKR